MRKILVAILCVCAMIMVPAMTLAKPKNDKHGSSHSEHGSPSPKSSAYEHADDNAKFQRDTHDLGKHQGQIDQEDKPGDKANDKSKDKDKSDKDEAKSESGNVKGKIN